MNDSPEHFEPLIRSLAWVAFRDAYLIGLMSEGDPLGVLLNARDLWEGTAIDGPRRQDGTVFPLRMSGAGDAAHRLTIGLRQGKVRSRQFGAKGFDAILTPAFWSANNVVWMSRFVGIAPVGGGPPVQIAVELAEDDVRLHWAPDFTLHNFGGEWRAIAHQDMPVAGVRPPAHLADENRKRRSSSLLASWWAAMPAADREQPTRDDAISFLSENGIALSRDDFDDAWKAGRIAVGMTPKAGAGRKPKRV